MSNNKTNDTSGKQSPDHRSCTRRRLLAGGVVSAFTVPLLPDQWTHPVVQSVLLPAHAQTSPCETSLELPGCEVSCSDEIGEEFRRYLITVSDDGCLDFTEVSGGEESHVRVQCARTDVDTVLAQFFAVTQSDGVERRDVISGCDPCTEDQPTTVGPFQLSDIPAQVTAEISLTCGNDPTAAISQVVVTPL